MTFVNVERGGDAARLRNRAALNATARNAKARNATALNTTALATGAALLAAALGAVAAAAQDQAPPPETIVVTGTRIQQPDFAFSNPVISVDSESLENSGQTNLTNFLAEIPALTGSFDSSDTGGSNAFVGGAGLNLLDLRYLGTDRTLVLVDGRRHVASLAETASVDIATIPLDLVDRVDVLTGGASAVYGADGVTGVVNFVMKRDFEGFSVRAQAGTPNAPGADSNLLSGVWGMNFAEGRGNLTLAAEYSYDGALYGYDRDFNGDEPGILTRFMRNPADTSDPPVGDGLADDPTVPDNIPITLVSYGDSARCGAVFASFANFPSPDFNCDGAPWDFGLLPPQIIGGAQDFPISPFHQSGGDATRIDDYLGNSTILPEIERVAFNAFANYEFNSALRWFGEAKYVDAEVFNIGQPSFDFYLFIEPDNPYIPLALQDDAVDNGGLYVSRDHIDLGLRGDEITRETQRYVTGFDGDLTDWLRYETSIVYGRSEVTAEQTNNRLNDRFFAALDVVDNGGTPDCRVNVDPTATPFDFPDPISYDPAAGECVPLNLFGEGVASPEAIDWVMATTTAVDVIEQTVVSGSFNGTLDPLLSLPGGSIGWAVGAEYREESSESTPDALDTAGATFGNVIQPNFGEFDVAEAFAEVDLPLLAGRPFFEELSLDAAYRYSDYSTIGDTGTWKVGGVWAPIPDISFRATTAEAVRAPNIGELFGAQNQRFEFIDDPCDVSLLDLGTQFREANCATILSGLGVDPATFVDPNSASIPGFSAGNPDLSEETAETNTYGVVLRPRFLPGLTVSVDYYDIELADAVQLIAPQEIAERCVDAPTLDNDFCPLIIRGVEETDGRIETFNLLPVNLAALTTSGYDFQINYTIDPADYGADGDWGVFNLRLVGNKLESLDFLPSPGGVVDDDVGEGPGASFVEQPVPEWQASFDVTWARGPWSVNYGFQWFDETSRLSNRSLYGDADLPDGNRDSLAEEYHFFDAKWSHDVQVEVALNDALSVYGGINNFTDEKPAFDQTFHPVSPVGRFFYVGVKAQFAALGDLVSQ